MKTLLLAFIALFIASGSDAAGINSFKALNHEVQQGDVIIFQIPAQWMPPATSNPSIFIFGKNYRPNAQGKVLVGVNMEIEPSKYIATFNENGIRSGWDYEEIEVLKSSFETTRTSWYTQKPSQRTDSQFRKILDAFGPKNQSEQDLTNGLGYIDPLGIPRDPIDHFGLIYKNNPYRRHEGVDLRTPIGSEVRAINGGKVVLVARNFRAEGNMVIINHGLGVFSVYMHLSKFRVKEGDTVKQKQVIALSGRTGAGVREPHLHFNVRIQDSYIDPLRFIDTINQYLYVK